MPKSEKTLSKRARPFRISGFLRISDFGFRILEMSLLTSAATKFKCRAPLLPTTLLVLLPALARAWVITADLRAGANELQAVAGRVDRPELEARGVAELPVVALAGDVLPVELGARLLDQL